MKFASVRIITEDVDRLADFYTEVTGITPNRPVPLFAEFVTEAGTLAIGSSQTLPLFPGTGLTVAHNLSAIIEFQTSDVDADHARLQAAGIEVLQEPTTMPWGNRALMLADPDGNRVNLYTPLSDDAVSRFAGRA